MLTAINFNNKACLEAHEVRCKSPDRNLAAEFETLKSSVAEGVPQFALGIGHP